MVAEATLNVKIVPEIEGLPELIEQLRRTGSALSGLADSLQRVSDGGGTAARTEPDTSPEAVCPFETGGVVHDAHTITVDTFRPGTVDVVQAVHDCPGFPVRPWHPLGRTT